MVLRILLDPALVHSARYPVALDAPKADAHATTSGKPGISGDYQLKQEAGMKVTGGCHCGHITYEAEVDPGTIGSVTAPTARN